MFRLFKLLFRLKKLEKRLEENIARAEWSIYRSNYMGKHEFFEHIESDEFARQIIGKINSMQLRKGEVLDE